jgi:site-specific recombinase XerD
MTEPSAPKVHMTLGEARDIYLQQADLRSPHTISAYRRAIELFINFLGDRTGSRRLPVQRKVYVQPEEIPLSAFTEDDAPLLSHFAEWLLLPGSGKKGDLRPYKPATVELRVAGIQNWLQFLDDHGWLPPSFQLAKARQVVHDGLREQPQHSTTIQLPKRIEEVVDYYDTQEIPPALRKPTADPGRIQRWELTRLRNSALLHSLAETGGRISEVLSLNLSDFDQQGHHQKKALQIEVVGKGGHTYPLHFLDSLSAIYTYIQARGVSAVFTSSKPDPLFVSHDPRYDGSRMSRVIAWRVVQRAARALGLRDITPHDFRHWRATQLISAGYTLDDVQDYLGHRSVETTRIYYGHPETTEDNQFPDSEETK